MKLLSEELIILKTELDLHKLQNILKSYNQPIQDIFNWEGEGTIAMHAENYEGETMGWFTIPGEWALMEETHRAITVESLLEGLLGGEYIDV